MREPGHLFDGLRGLGQCWALPNWHFARWVASKHILLPNTSLDAPIQKKKIAGSIITIMEGSCHWVDSCWGLDTCWIVSDGSSPANLGPFWRLLLDQANTETCNMGVNHTKEPGNGVVIVYMAYMDHIWTVVLVLMCTGDLPNFLWLSLYFKWCPEQEPAQIPQ